MRSTPEKIRIGLTVLLPVLLGLVPSGRPLEAQALVSFAHGVASGDVTATSAVLWTRVDRPAPLIVEVSPDATFQRLTFTRSVQAEAASDFTVKVVAAPLEPGRTYFYRWYDASLNAVHPSEVGSFKTPPLLSASSGVVRFAFTGDTDGTRVDGKPFFNNFEALDAARRENLDFFVYLGDTIYADADAGGHTADATLDEFRASYKVNRQVPALRNLLQATSTYATWSDHEVRDNYAGQTVDPALYANGRRAFLEYMPMLEPNVARDAGCAGSPLFRVFHWGADIDLFILDERSCRSAEADARCPGPVPRVGDLAPTLPAAFRAQFSPFLSPMPAPGCLEALADPARTMLGKTQKQLFEAALLSSTARFKFVINELPIQQLFLLPYDRWEGYAAERKEILDFIRDRAIKNVIFLATDIHANVINDVFIDRFTDPRPIAQEFVTGPVAIYTSEADTLRTLGPLFGPRAVAAAHTLMTIAGVQCRHLNAYSYGLVEVDARAGTVTVTLKDDKGAVLHDELNPGITCRKTIRGE